MANNIVEFNIDGTSYTQRPYGTCSTAAGTAAKVVTCSGFNLVTGATVMVKFTNANTVANPTLNVNSKGAKAIYYRGAALTASSLANWGAGDVVEFRYNGTQWDLLNVGNTNTDTNTNYYPTAFAWTNGSTAGPTGSLTGSGMSAVSFGAIPSASASISGVVTTGAQTFAGAKTFNGGITVASPGATWQSNMTAGCINASYTSYGAIFNAPVKSGRVCISTYPGQTDLMYFGYYKSTSTENILDEQMTWDAPNNTLTVDILKGKLDWSYIQNKPTIPTIPTIGNGTITIKQNGTSKGTFTVNQTGDTTIELTDTGIISQDHYKTSVTAGTAGTLSATSGSTLAVPYVTVNANGHVTGYGTHTHTISGFLTSETYTGTVTSITPGTGLTGTSSDTAITSSGTINLKVASSSEIGGVKPGTTNGKTYGVAVSSTGEMTVNVPWTDTNTKVTQTVTSSNANYPILLAPSTQTTTTTGTAYFETAIEINPYTRKINGVDYISADSTDLHIQCDEWLILDGGGDECGIKPNSSSINNCDLGTDSIRFRNGYFSNQVFAANGFYESSDERLKDFGEGLNVDLDALSKIRKSYFTFKDKPENPQIGVSAQEIQKLYPEVVIETSDGHLNVDYAKLSVVALAAIDQLNDKVKSLEDRLARLEKLLENK